ncbi:hypothetical protein DIPPA_00502 [Diplonema papillatum]|nr:hypothetical protein DIPPA_00502 [Diplonema papillatum]
MVEMMAQANVEAEMEEVVVLEQDDSDYVSSVNSDGSEAGDVLSLDDTEVAAAAIQDEGAAPEEREDENEMDDEGSEAAEKEESNEADDADAEEEPAVPPAKKARLEASGGCVMSCLRCLYVPGEPLPARERKQKLFAIQIVVGSVFLIFIANVMADESTIGFVISLGLGVGVALTIVWLVIAKTAPESLVVVITAIACTGIVWGDLWSLAKSNSTFYPLFVIVLDFLLVLRSPRSYSQSVIVVMIVWMAVVSLEEVYRVGLYDLSVLPDQEQRRSEVQASACEKLPCPKDFFAVVPLQIFRCCIVFIDYWLTRDFATRLFAEQEARQQSADAIRDIARHLSRFNLNSASERLTASDGNLPPDLVASLRNILINLEGYRRYLPRSCLQQDEDEGSDPGDRSDRFDESSRWANRLSEQSDGRGCLVAAREDKSIASRVPTGDPSDDIDGDLHGVGPGTPQTPARVKGSAAALNLPQPYRNPGASYRFSSVTILRITVVFEHLTSTNAPLFARHLSRLVGSALHAAECRKGIIDLLEGDVIFVSFNAARHCSRHCIHAVETSVALLLEHRNRGPDVDSASTVAGGGVKMTPVLANDASVSSSSGRGLSTLTRSSGASTFVAKTWRSDGSHRESCPLDSSLVKGRRVFVDSLSVPDNDSNASASPRKAAKANLRGDSLSSWDLPPRGPADNDSNPSASRGKPPPRGDSSASREVAAAAPARRGTDIEGCQGTASPTKRCAKQPDVPHRRVTDIDASAQVASPGRKGVRLHVSGDGSSCDSNSSASASPRQPQPISLPARVESWSSRDDRRHPDNDSNPSASPRKAVKLPPGDHAASPSRSDQTVAVAGSPGLDESFRSQKEPAGPLALHRHDSVRKVNNWFPQQPASPPPPPAVRPQRSASEPPSDKKLSVLFDDTVTEAASTYARSIAAARRQRDAERVLSFAGAGFGVYFAASSGRALCGDFGCAELQRFGVVGAASALSATLSWLGRSWDISIVCDVAVQREVMHFHETAMLPRSVSVPFSEAPVAVYEVLAKARKEDGKSEEWMYELQDAAAWDAFNAAVKCFMQGNREAAEHWLSSDTRSGRTVSHIEALKQFMAIHDFIPPLPIDSRPMLAGTRTI